MLGGLPAAGCIATLTANGCIVFADVDIPFLCHTAASAAIF